MLRVSAETRTLREVSANFFQQMCLQSAIVFVATAKKLP